MSKFQVTWWAPDGYPYRNANEADSGDAWDLPFDPTGMDEHRITKGCRCMGCYDYLLTAEIASESREQAESLVRRYYPDCEIVVGTGPAE